jgi:hypothetical protein
LKGNLGTAVVLGGSLLYAYVKVMEDDKKKGKSIEVTPMRSRIPPEMESAHSTSSSMFRNPADSEDELRPILSNQEEAKSSMHPILGRKLA